MDRVEDELAEVLPQIFKRCFTLAGHIIIEGWQNTHYLPLPIEFIMHLVRGRDDTEDTV